MEDAIEGSAPPPKGSLKLYIGQNGPSLWREGMEVSNPIVDGLSVSYFLKILLVSNPYSHS